MAQHRIHHGDDLAAAVDGGMRNPRRNAHPGAIFVLQSDQLKASVLQHDQIEAATQHHQLIGLVTMTEKLGMGGCMHFCNKGFVAWQRITEKSDS